MAVSIIPSYDMDFINAVLKDEEMWPRVSLPGQDRDTFYMLPKPEDFFLVPVINNVRAGFYWIHPMGSDIYQIHANILKDHRINAKSISDALLNWCSENLPPTIKHLACFVPAKFKDVYYHCLKMGFSEIGTIGDKYLLNIERELWPQQQS